MTNSPLNILKIDSSSRVSGSVSRQLSAQVADRFVAENSDSNLVTRDVTKGLPTVSEDWIGANFTPADDRTDAQKDLLTLSDELVTELRAADVLVIGVPIYNFGVPASLKA